MMRTAVKVALGTLPVVACAVALSLHHLRQKRSSLPSKTFAKDVRIFQHPEAVRGSWDRCLVVVETPSGFKAAHFDDGMDFVMKPDKFLSRSEMLEEIVDAVANGYQRIDTETYSVSYGIKLEKEAE